MANTTKRLSDVDANSALRGAFNDSDMSLTINGYLAGTVGRKVTMAISTTSVSNDTETYTFSENGTNLYAIKVIYTTGTRDVFLSAERIS